MRFVLLGLGIYFCWAVLGSRAEAQTYPWCAVYSGELGGSKNCGFTTFEQCMATVRGLGGFCSQNPQY